jgi:diguanylate cyclase (GGDEF)-like protein
MASVMTGGTDRLGVPRARRGVPRHGLGALVRRLPLPTRLGRDPYLAYTAALAPIALIAMALSQQAGAAAGVVVVSVVFIGLQATLGLVPARSRPLSPLGWSFLRLTVAFLFVASMVELSGGAGGPLVSLFLPVVAAAAALGTIQAVVIGALASIVYLAPELARLGTSADLALRGIALAGVSVLLTVGIRRLVITIEATSRSLRSAALTERRRSRQIAAMEAVSRLLVDGGHTGETLDRALAVLSERFGYQYVSVYLLDGDLLVLGAQRGYANPIRTFDGTIGVTGRVMRTHALAFVPDVRSDPDYVAADPAVSSEICAPLIVDGQFLGMLNVESTSTLDRTDRDLVATLADRVATVVALGRDRHALAAREAALRSLHEFTEAVSASLDVDRLSETMVEAAQRVIPADHVALVTLDRETGRYHLRAVTNYTDQPMGGEVRSGEGLAGRAIRDRTLVIDDHYSAAASPGQYRNPEGPANLLGAGIPLVRDSVVVGALSIVRKDNSQTFSPVELEAMDLLAGHAALAVANAFLHAEVEELAIRDPLTGLYNRRYFDEALERLLISWRRADPLNRQQVAAIMFDLDHFGEFNKRHGHQVGDEVLRTFAAILRTRFRAADLVARIGGEEFVAILEGANRDDALRIADDVRTLLADRTLVSADGTELTVNVSAGCSELDEAEPTREHLLRTADVALFMAKRAGRNRVVAA